MDKAMPNFAFNTMSTLLKLRDLLRPRDPVLREANIKPGSRVLDYGCGPGGYVAGAAKLVGQSGKVYALDLHPLAIRRVQKLARKKQLANVQTIHSDRQTGLPDNSVDIVLLHDIFHLLDDPQAILAELARVLKQNGTLSVSDHHMQEETILSGITGGHLFRLVNKGEHSYNFGKQTP